MTNPYDKLAQFKQRKISKIKSMGTQGNAPQITSMMQTDSLGELKRRNVPTSILTETAKEADLVMPASLPFEIGGSFTTTQKHIQKFEKQIEPDIEKTSPQQIIDLLQKLGVNGIADMEEALWEAFGLLPPASDPEKRKFPLNYTKHDNFNRMFDHGCDNVNKRFDDEFEISFK